MRLLSQWILIAMAVILLGFASETLTRRYVIWPEAKEISDRLDRKELEQVLLGFDVLRAQLLTFSRTNGYWDLVHDYLDKPEESFIAENFPLAVFEQNGFHLVMFASADRKFQKVLMTSSDQESFLAQAILGIEDFQSVIPDASKALPNAPLETSGFVKTLAGPMIFAAVTVMRTELNSASPGVMVIARFINEETVEEVRETVKRSFEVAPVKESQRPTLLADAQRDENNKIFTDLLDVHGKSLLRIVMSLPVESLNRWWSLASTVSLMVFILGTGLAMALVNRSLVVPIRAITQYLHNVRETGDYTARLRVKCRNELSLLVEECNNLLANIDTQHHRLEEQAHELRRLSLHDALTQISNRRHFDEALDSALANAQRQKMPLTLMICDVDHFKLFNDTYGHQGGDKALQALAEILLLARHRKTDMVARYGGEEFVVMLPDTDEHGARHVLANIHNLLARAHIPHSSSPISEHLTISIGVTTMHAPFDLTAQELIRRADDALYMAKKYGRNRFEFWMSPSAVASPVKTG
jgi:diguanylate cyclase (GGDEF)-like protein